MSRIREVHDYLEAMLHAETQLRVLAGEPETPRPLSQWDLRRMRGYLEAQFRHVTRENVRALLDEARYLEYTAVDLELASMLLDRAGFPEEAGTVPERLRMLIVAHEQELAALGVGNPSGAAHG